MHTFPSAIRHRWILQHSRCHSASPVPSDRSLVPIALPAPAQTGNDPSSTGCVPATQRLPPSLRFSPDSLGLVLQSAASAHTSDLASHDNFLTQVVRDTTNLPTWRGCAGSLRRRKEVARGEDLVEDLMHGGTSSWAPLLLALYGEDDVLKDTLEFFFVNN